MKLRLFLYIVMVVSIISCQEDACTLINMMEPDKGLDVTRSSVNTEPSALIQGEDGYWRATRRVPLVGAGRIVDNMSDALIGVVNWTGSDNNMGFLTDMNIDNSFAFGGVVDAQAITNQLASVRDLVHTYAGGQTAGFVYRLTNEGLLTLDVLKGFWIDTYLKGEKQEHAVITNESGVLGLSLVSVANNDGKQALSISASLDKPFDEIRIGISGIDVSAVASGLELYYAFVGDNPVHKATTDNTQEFPNGVSINKKAGMTGAIWTPDNIIDPDTEGNGGTIELLAALLQPFVTVDLKREIAPDTEVGFCVSGGGLLDLGLLGATVLKTFDADNNEQESYTFGSLLGLSLIHGSSDQYYSLRVTKPCSQIQLGFFGINLQLLSAKVIKYAYIRDTDLIDASSYVSYPDVTIHSSGYRLAQPDEGSVTFDILSMPAGSTAHFEDGKIVGMNANGPHKILATYTSPDDRRYSQTFTVTLDKTAGGVSDKCNIPINETDYSATAYNPEGGGSLLSLEGGDSEKYKLTNDDKNDYVKYSPGISLAGNYGILGIKLGEGKTINSERKQVRTGFVIRDGNSVLNLSALRFFRVRLLKDGQYVSSNNGQDVSDENETISLGLIGGADSNEKTRMSITTDAEFDAIELWSSGVLNLNLNEMEIYHAFWEEVEAGCASPETECIELISAGSYGTTIDYAQTGTDGVATVGTSFSNLGNLLDNDIETYAEVVVPVNLIGEVAVATKFNTIAPNQEVGIIMQDMTGVASVDLVKWITLSVSKDGVEVGSSNQNGVLDLKLIGYGGKQYISILPTQEFNEMKITFGGVLDALKTFRLNGLYLRPDSDGDGVIDCVEPLPEPSFTNVEVLSERICVPQVPEFNAVGGQDGMTYRLHFNDISYANNDFICTATLNTATQRFTFTDPSIEFNPGDYYVGIYDNSDTDCEGMPLYNGVHVSIHPTLAIWNGSVSEDWNNWENWDTGIPWGCTDVVLPTGCTYYPVLKDEYNCCNRIRFCPNSEIANIQHLEYSSAWVDLKLASNRYHLLSMPLKETYSGDLFVASGNTEISEHYPELTEASNPQNRFAPSAYQRKWQEEISGIMTMDGVMRTVPLQGNGWTKPYNSVDEEYKAVEGFSFWLDHDADMDFVIRLPKKHTEYNYYNSSDQTLISTIPAASVTRSVVGGRFITENEENVTLLPIEKTLTRQSAGKVFVMGNPFMAHLDIHRLIAGNTGVKGIKRYCGEEDIPDAGDYLLEELSSGLISPMEAFYLITESEATSINILITEDMIYQYNGFNNR